MVNKRQHCSLPAVRKGSIFQTVEQAQCKKGKLQQCLRSDSDDAEKGSDDGGADDHSKARCLSCVRACPIANINEAGEPTN